MSYADCLFVFPPGGNYQFEQFSYALGSGYVIAYLRDKGVEAAQFYCNESLSASECAARVLALSPKVVGFTVFNTNFISCLLIAEQIKKHSRDTVVVFGGPTASNYAEFIVKRYPYVDVCVRNESEEVFFELFLRLQQNMFRVAQCVFEDVKSITCMQDGKVMQNRNADIFLRNSRTVGYLDAYPSPYLTGVIPGDKAALVGMITARGCNQHCTYCNCAVLSQGTISTHSIDRVVAEVEYISRYLQGNQTLNIYDDAFTLLKSRAKKICRSLIDNQIKANLGCITRCDCVDEELLELMKEAGFVSIGFSLESAVPRILRIIGKVGRAEDVPSDDLDKEKRFIATLGKVTTFAKKIGIKTVYSSIMVGLPSETPEDANKTVDTIDGIEAIDTYTHNYLTIYHGTPLHQRHKKYDYRIKHIDNVPVFGVTKYPTDTAVCARVSTKSQISSNRKQYDKATIRILAMHSSRTAPRTSFENIVIVADRLSKDVVVWMQDCVAINANVIQLYKDRQKYVSHVEENSEMLYRYYGPSQNVHNYYLSGVLGRCDIVSSYAIAMRDEDGNRNLKMTKTSDALESYERGEGGPFGKVVCLDSTRDDCRSVLALLREVSDKKEPFDYLASSRPLPWCSGLCRWSRAGANCETLETAIVDRYGKIKLCWAGDPIGVIGDRWSAIVRSVKHIKDRAKEARRCQACQHREKCVKCIAPVSGAWDEYCSNVDDKIAGAAELVGTFNLLSEYGDA